MNTFHFTDTNRGKTFVFRVPEGYRYVQVTEPGSEHPKLRCWNDEDDEVRIQPEDE